MAEIVLEGMDELAKALLKEASLETKKRAIKKHTSNLQKKAKRNAVFTKGYATGATKRKIDIEISGGGLVGKVEAGTEYSGYLEEGTRFMEAQPFMKPALEETVQELIEDLGSADE